MKKGIIPIFLVLTWACSNPQENVEEQTTEVTEEVAEESNDQLAMNEDFMIFGDSSITPDNAVPTTEVMAMLQGKDSIRVKAEGTINAVCQKKGCWMTLDMGDGKEMRVKFKDYEFFVPKNSADRTAIVEGWAYVRTIPVAELRHLADDAGKSKEEQAAITEPKTEYSFMADGVIIR
ncbi:MAG: DUF4920 domain-containing protein [Bacteroidota bacterium]|nr:DUF4920 domain-containing protein [Bacteroidota bacterium]MDX5427575.1 DUF4920 domain-containing protein [Bacteroidota bacterium]MDX5448847.1 DUF4920 domain-containing protein [Bacteroidota bacterium]MDX5505493.1 DUF4920 domain-containing protein [Bacteroidota bacterium]